MVNHEHQISFFCQSGNCLAFGYCSSHRFFYQYMLTGFKLSAGKVKMRGNGRSDDYRVQLAVGKKIITVSSCFYVRIMNSQRRQTVNIQITNIFDAAIINQRKITDKIGAPIAKTYYSDGY